MININGNVFRGDVKIAYGRFVNGLKNSQIHKDYKEFDTTFFDIGDGIAISIKR